MNPIDRLALLFLKFPGIGTRQARRFVYFLLMANSSYIKELISALQILKTEVHQCVSCYRFFENSSYHAPNAEKPSTDSVCSLCTSSIHATTLIVVEKDIDIENIQKGSVYAGAYFVLGGLLSPLGKNSGARTKELLEKIKRELPSREIKEIIIALNVHPNGDYTALHIKNMLTPVIEKYGIRITMLGRGLSTGTELEYSDTETIKYALENRK